ncbi:hypothetical protein RsS62_13150 [Rhizobium dioscoreae]|uniref:Uncharacterized protein n=1 Tax=Rhizobium dioscoreae TaxID=2653122 RepID=A0ABQ0Z203_9HYPH|nr:hypothetical protein RsS62_13150 [Rhizobium dioscoreae]GES49371.1 hypothetical protein RsS93_19850 [Rhizobium dioscoreae]GLU80813.1 hypothetical protein Rhsp01_19890 [Rhizobium sp. NBRC 114257]
MRTKASIAVETSKTRFSTPPVGGKTSLSAALKKADVADLVADFIEKTPFMLTIGRKFSDA